MKYKRLHNWNVSPRQAIFIQKRLAKEIILKGTRSSITRIAACDVGFTRQSNKVVAAWVVFSFPELLVLEKVIRLGQTIFPYVPGLLTFREGPILLKAFSALKNRPDLVIFDGQGIAHPRRMGLATHMGILLNLPTIGCAKSFLYGKFTQPPNFKGAYAYIQDKNKEIIGAALRTRKDVRCVFVSCGHKVSLKAAIKIILACSLKFRIPEPLRVAHNLTRSFLR